MWFCKARNIAAIAAMTALFSFSGCAEPNEAAPRMTFTRSGDSKNLVARGAINLETPTLFGALMASMRRAPGSSESAVIEIDSPGGSLIGGMVLGRAIRAYGLSTSVRSGRECASACAIAFMGGVTRFVARDGKLGVHQFASPPTIKIPDSAKFPGQDVVAGQDLVGQLLDYAKEMGVSTDIIAIASRTPPSDIHWLSPEDIASSNLGEIVSNAAPEPNFALRSTPSGTQPMPPPSETPIVPRFVSTPPAQPITLSKSTLKTVRAAMLFSVANDPKNPLVSPGTAVWSMTPGESSVRAEVDIPDAKIHALVTIHKNTDTSLSASHTIDLVFTFDSDSKVKEIMDVALPRLRLNDSSGADVVRGARAKIGDNHFLFGLNNSDTDISRNLDLIATHEWFDFPLLLSDGLTAKLTFEKSAEGDRVIEKALAVWSQ
jgi:hypothetical protein